MPLINNEMEYLGVPNSDNASASLAGFSTSTALKTFPAELSAQHQDSISRKTRLFPELFGPTNKVTFSGVMASAGAPTLGPALKLNFLICRAVSIEIYNHSVNLVTTSWTDIVSSFARSVKSDMSCSDFALP